MSQASNNDCASEADNVADADDIADAKVKKASRSGWLLTMISVVVLVWASVFFITTQFTKVGENSKALDKSCVRRNEELVAVNKKFDQLVSLFDASMRNRVPGQPAPADEILQLYAEFRKPIPLVDCAQ